jgi:gas vesicle protein
MIFNIICAILTIASFVVTLYAIDQWKKSVETWRGVCQKINDDWAQLCNETIDEYNSEIKELYDKFESEIKELESRVNKNDL